MLTRMPIIHMKLIESKKKATKGIYNCPCYVYPDRQGSRDKPSYVMSFDLKVTSSTTCFGSPSLTLHLTGREARIGILAETRSRSAVVLHRRLLANSRVHCMKNCCVYCKLADISDVASFNVWRLGCNGTQMRGSPPALGHPVQTNTGSNLHPHLLGKN